MVPLALVCALRLAYLVDQEVVGVGDQVLVLCALLCSCHDHRSLVDQKRVEVEDHVSVLCVLHNCHDLRSLMFVDPLGLVCVLLQCH